PILSERACDITCGGSGMGWYTDTATRLLTWFIPAIILISSISLAPIGVNRFVTISHLFGDPIHSLWSLLSKLEDWNHCYDMARRLHPDTSRPSNDPRNIGVLIAAIRELQQPNNYDTDVTGIHYTCPCRCFRGMLGTLHTETAGNLVEKRTTGTSYAWFAIFTYIFGIVCLFVPILGANLSPFAPSGTKIAPAMLLSWLLPVILLNNIVGQFRVEDCIRIVRQFEEDIETFSKVPRGPHLPNCNRNLTPHHQPWTANLEDRCWKKFPNSQAWSGGIYSCQLKKPMLESGERRVRSWLLVAIATTSVCISFTMAFVVLYSYPTFFSCRSIMIIGMTIVWLLSPFMTRIIMTNSIFGVDDKTRWKVLFFKDYLIGFSILFLLVASSCGLGNSCRCWAGFSNKIGGVALSPGTQFTQNNKYIYPILISSCLFAQYLIFKISLYLGRTGLGVMTWSEGDRRNSLPKRAAAANQQLPAAASISDSGSEEQDSVAGESGYELLGLRAAS
ncbi:hypothetical protein N431DRAFT_354301, partial [Stipitochalara longipes BDJ]